MRWKTLVMCTQPEGEINQDIGVVGEAEAARDGCAILDVRVVSYGGSLADFEDYSDKQ